MSINPRHIIRCVVIFAALLLAIFFTSCKTSRPVVVTTHQDSIATQRHDSISSVRAESELNNLERILDSVSVEVWHRDVLRGDSIVAQRDSSVTIRTIYRDRYITDRQSVHDTIRVHDHDTTYVYKEIPVEVPVEKIVEVEKAGNRFLHNSGIALWVLIGLFVLAVIAGIVLKFAK